MEKNLGIKWYQTIDSTNSQANRELADAPHGSVWVADFQTAGRGQRGNRWESKSAENLTFSILLRPTFLHPAQQFHISRIASLGVLRYLHDKGLDAKIKWPNDIYIGNKKICGMLIENSISTDKLSASIVGIGLNLNQRGFSSKLTNPTSLIMEKLSAEGNSDLPDKIYDRKDELSLLLGYIFTAYSELEEGYCKELEEEYHRNLYRLGEFHRFIEIDQDAPADIPVERISRGKEITARILGTDEYGCAIMEHISGEIKHYPFKGIRYVL
ncbi:MAG: biotin--[acetyl-CoA-carboxylase] ligase [Bacteroidales bacterium]|nr:biotin--[acetyl-CoA-carboxylase] ligase [Bacteroidales bacterium]